MEFWRSILAFLDTQATEPAPYGIFHLLCLGVTAALTALAVLRGRHHSEDKIRKVVFFTALAVVILEVYKQINFTFGNGSEAPEYLWYAFPWQFCSTPMYIGLLAGILRKGRIHDSLCAYLATYAVFAGVAVMLYPNDVYVETLGINIQTMVCHGSMVVIGGYLLGSGHVALKLKTVLKAMPVFAVCVAIAFGLNELAHAVGITADHNFNMFYISPYKECSLPVYSLVHNSVPFPVNLMIYILGFTAAATLILLICMGIARLSRKRIAADKAAVAPVA